MDQTASALGDAARWRIVELLAERPRSVGELAELTGLRQPQTTKHLQTLARAGLVTAFPLGPRRVYALEAGPLTSFELRLRQLVDTVQAHEGERDVIARYRAATEAEAAAADRDGWADDRTFTFDRTLPAPRDVVWRYWTDPDLLATWWAPPSMTITDCALEPKPGGRAVLNYRDAEGQYHSEGRVHTAKEPEHLVFDLVVTASSTISFTSHYDLTLTDAEEGADEDAEARSGDDTRLHLDLRLTETTVEAAAYIAGIETGWGQVLNNLADTVTETPAKGKAAQS